MNVALARADHREGGAEVFDAIADAVEREGFAHLAAALPAELGAALCQRIRTLDPDDDLSPAGIGREAGHHVNRFVRTDQIRWLGRENGAEAAYLAWMENLRLGLNRRLFLGLFDYECHFAHYRRGDYYKRHSDAFRGETNRVLSTVFYLNPGWMPGDGGELVVYRDDTQEPMCTLAPLYGHLVVFLSEEFPHEVLASRRDRYSIAGWFRVNNSVGGAIDPPA